MIDVEEHITAVRREVGGRVLEAGEARTVTLTRIYGAPVEDVWDACTSAERLPRWFLPVTGELRLGGRFQLEGNAGGTIERCDPPRSFFSTWEYDGDVSWITLTLTPTDDGGTRFALEHLMYVDDHWEQYGPGATGVGWDGALVGLTLHLETGEATAAVGAEWGASDEGRDFMARSSAAWARRGGDRRARRRVGGRRRRPHHGGLHGGRVRSRRTSRSAARAGRAAA